MLRLELDACWLCSLDPACCGFGFPPAGEELRLMSCRCRLDIFSGSSLFFFVVILLLYGRQLALLSPVLAVVYVNIQGLDPDSKKSY